MEEPSGSVALESGLSNLTELPYLRISSSLINLQLVWFASVELFWLTSDSSVQGMLGRALRLKAKMPSGRDFLDICPLSSHF